MFRRIVSAVVAFTLLFGGITPVLAEMSFEDAESEIVAETTVVPVEETVTDEEAVSEEEDYVDTTESEEFPTLQNGSKDDETTQNVLSLQTRLSDLGFLSDDEADGAFGQKTEEAVEYFQRLNGLEATGVADYQTQILLYSDASALTTPSPDYLSGSDQNVRIQTMLVTWGFLYTKVDGKIGKTSKTAIKTFKEYLYSYDLLPTPTPSPEPTPVPTAAPGELPLVADVLKATPTPEPTVFEADDEITDLILSYANGIESFEVYREDVAVGDEGMEVYRIQARLKSLNYLYRKPDKQFGLNSQRALMYFQRKNGLDETGIADEATQRALFSENAIEAEEYVFPYKIYVDISDQTVYVFRWDGEAYSIPERKMLCSTGKNETPTPTGTFQAYGQLDLEDGEWYWFKTYKCYAKYAYGIVGGVLFHSITYNKNKKQIGSEKNLGRKASHGCIRLSVENAKWIYDNCPYGTTVVIQD